MKKKIIIAVIIIFIILFLIGAFLSTTRLGVLNPISALCGIAKIYLTDNKLTVVQNFPQKVIFFMREDGKNYFDDYMEKLGGYVEIPYSADAGDTVYTNGEKNIYVRVAGNRFARYTLIESRVKDPEKNADMITYTNFDNIIKYQEECPYKSNITVKVNGETVNFIIVPIKINNKFYKTMNLQELATNMEKLKKEYIKEDLDIEISTSLQTINRTVNISSNGIEQKIEHNKYTEDGIIIKSIGKGTYVTEISDNNYETVLRIVLK